MAAARARPIWQSQYFTLLVRPSRNCLSEKKEYPKKLENISIKLERIPIQLESIKIKLESIPMKFESIPMALKAYW